MSSTKVITGKVRFSYAHVWEPKAMDENSKAKYSVSIIIPKSDKATVKKIKDAIDAALEQGKASKFGGKLPPKWKNPLRDGDEERPDDEAYENSYFVNASSVKRPGIVDNKPQPEAITDELEFYSGVFGRASINFYPFSMSGNKGVAAGLQNLQKLEDGDPLGSSGASAASDFGSSDFDDDLG